MKHHIEFMEAFLAGLRSLPNPDKYPQAYIRTFEMCLYSPRNHPKSNKINEKPTNETVQRYLQAGMQKEASAFLDRMELFSY